MDDAKTTVNSENFARFLFSQNYAKFRENKILTKWRNLCHFLMKVNHVIVANFYIADMSFNAIRDNKIAAKISEFTVYPYCIPLRLHQGDNKYDN